MAVFLLLTLLCQQDYEYRKGEGVVDLTTGQVRTPDELLKFALAEREAGRPGPAVSALTFLSTRIPDVAIRETAQFERATTYYKSGAYYESYHDFKASSSSSPSPSASPPPSGLR